MSLAILAVPSLWPMLGGWALLGTQMAVAVIVYVFVVFCMSGQQIAELRRVFIQEKSLDV
jgi:hypothetical protein